MEKALLYSIVISGSFTMTYRRKILLERNNCCVKKLRKIDWRDIFVMTVNKKVGGHDNNEVEAN